MKIKGNLKNINKISNDTEDKLLIPAIEETLRNLKAGVDRGHGWNSPSSVGYCSRSVYFGRIGLPPDFPSNEPRLQRIFDNGTYTHIRLQRYLLQSGVLLADEAPLYDKAYQIMGTTDGLLLDKDKSIAVLEIKSINSMGFAGLKDAKPEHKMQASIYMYCLNTMRNLILLGKRKELEQEYLYKLDSFLEDTTSLDGKVHFKKDKVNSRFKDFKNTLNFLEQYPKPIKKVVFLYENKDTQELKEFAYTDKAATTKALKKFSAINDAVRDRKVPEAEKTFMCNGCHYRKVCANYA